MSSVFAPRLLPKHRGRFLFHRLFWRWSNIGSDGPYSLRRRRSCLHQRRPFSPDLVLRCPAPPVVHQDSTCFEPHLPSMPERRSLKGSNEEGCDFVEQEPLERIWDLRNRKGNGFGIKGVVCLAVTSLAMIDFSTSISAESGSIRDGPPFIVFDMNPKNEFVPLLLVLCNWKVLCNWESTYQTTHL
ncbi:hypothetical protein MRB53_030813 [Persea americana]|uniref:Uncharacterized protein n=1 Tax=Persea americana TaxID=3435 RepID=A0ACC2KMB4_PERAE|nr:hypothetical protein MRB53_030813 [Persea americana]